MPVPWEALIPTALLVSMFAVTGTLANVSFRAQNQWKPPRYHLEDFEVSLMERDKKLTGHLRGQTSDPAIPQPPSSS
uniref:NADH dehydrogenase [ubiquinone] 1 alpha subcomplex subunit 1 n=1 Tax=Mycena chlorophos TaxID=658473 RepID=A0ABQ0M1N5_MYCCL|nr:predicted protein [Mycena chlorophos]